MQPSNIATITSQFFQPALSAAATAASSGLLADRLGLVVTDLDDIGQCIDIILHTPRGSDPHRPDFGANLDQYIDWPLSAARPRIAREVQRALTRWEPRANVLKVNAQYSAMGQLLVPVTWQPVASYNGQPIVTSLAFGKLS
ncbi:GPW/gp25 family protein [Paraburkholderia sp.]|uniref:GPW/gp25 family protein n=1 Tax=Paraburkholderia sp. TaxID=1926495 RepID=UPI003D6FA6E4